MEADLDMTGAHDYNVALTIFFVSYAGAEPFTNLVLKKTSPRIFFTAVVLSWVSQALLLQNSAGMVVEVGDLGPLHGLYGSCAQ